MRKPGVSRLVMAGAALVMLSRPAFGQSKSPSIAELQQRIDELTSKVQALEQLNQKIERLEGLDQQVKVLDRRFEIQAEDAREKARTLPVVEASSKGFFLGSQDGDFSLRLRGYIQADSRFYTTGDKPTTGSTFVLQRVRPVFEGTVFKYYDFKIMPDFGLGTTVLQDAYLDLRYFPRASLELGKYKPPFDLERLQSARDLLFVHRALTINLVPNRDLGVQLHGELFGSRLSYALGLFNGAPDNTATADLDSNDAKDFVGRVFAHPFRNSSFALGEGFGLGMAGSVGNERGSLPSYKTTGQTTFFTYKAGFTASGERFRYSPQAYYYHGPFGLLAEFVENSQEITGVKSVGKKKVRASEMLRNQAWQLTSSWLVTGEDASYTGVEPRRVFDPAKGQWGAFELKARVSALQVDRDAFTNGFADPTASAREAFEWGLGFNWYLNGNVKFQTDYVRTSFDKGGVAGHNRKDESAILSRFQLAF